MSSSFPPLSLYFICCHLKRKSAGTGSTRACAASAEGYALPSVGPATKRSEAERIKPAPAAKQDGVQRKADSF